MTYSEILDELKTLGIEGPSCEFKSLVQDGKFWNSKDEKVYPSKALGPIKEVAHYGGEGHGETYFIVAHFLDHDVYIKAGGYYYSYDGTTWDANFQEVKPVVKTVVEYV